MEEQRLPPLCEALIWTGMQPVLSSSHALLVIYYLIYLLLVFYGFVLIIMYHCMLHGFPSC